MERIDIGSSTFYHGDCFDVLQKLDTAVEQVISDPPFALTDCDWDVVLPLKHLWQLFDEKSRPSANYVLFAAGHFAVDLANSKYKWYRYDLVWSKNNRCGFLNANRQPLRSHENILVFGRPGEQKNAVYHPQWEMADCRPQTGADASVSQSLTPNPKSLVRKGGIYPSRPYLRKLSDGKRHPHSVLCYKNEFGLHPTQKPTALLEFLVQSYSSENDIVLDPFMGSGTTGIACALHNRRFIGIEKERKYFDIAVERMKKVESRKKGVGSRGGRLQTADGSRRKRSVIPDLKSPLPTLYTLLPTCTTKLKTKLLCYGQRRTVRRSSKSFTA